MKISLCMIVKNEEDVLERCLKSVEGIADEIIIVDTGSTDTTKEIAGRYTPSVYEFTWRDDFAAARNFSFSKALGDYILWLDADDILLEEDREKLLRFKRSFSGGADVYMMKYNVAFDKAGRPAFTYYRERLLKRSAGPRWEGAVHEVIQPSGDVVYLDIAVTHSKLHPSDPDRNLRIFERLLKEGKSLDPRQSYYYARELYYHDRLEEAASEFCRFLEEGKGWRENSISACLDLSRCYEKLSRPKETFEALFKSFLYAPPRAEICCEIGRLFIEKEEYASAVFWYETASRCSAREVESAGGFVSLECYDFIPFMQLCVCWDRLGDHKKAYFFHCKAKALRPEDESVLYNEAYFSSLQVMEAAEGVSDTSSDMPGRNSAKNGER